MLAMWCVMRGNWVFAWELQAFQQSTFQSVIERKRREICFLIKFWDNMSFYVNTGDDICGLEIDYQPPIS